MPSPYLQRAALLYPSGGRVGPKDFVVRIKHVSHVVTSLLKPSRSTFCYAPPQVVDSRASTSLERHQHRPLKAKKVAVTAGCRALISREQLCCTAQLGGQPKNGELALAGCTECLAGECVEGSASSEKLEKRPGCSHFASAHFV